MRTSFLVLLLSFIYSIAPGRLDAEMPSAPAAPLDSDSNSAVTNPSILVIMKNGQQYKGRIVRSEASSVSLELEGGVLVTIPESAIERIVDANSGQRAPRSPDPGRTRYFFTQSAFMMKSGESSISQTELFFTMASYGVSDHVTIGAGTIVPYLFMEDARVFIGTLRVGAEVAEHVRLAASVQGLTVPGVEGLVVPNYRDLAESSPDPRFMGFVFGTATVGTADAHVSASVGWPFILGTESRLFRSDVLISLSGSLRILEGVALVGETWLFPSRDSISLSGGGIRIIGQRLCVDTGVYFDSALSLSIPLPWLDFTWHLGSR